MARPTSNEPTSTTFTLPQAVQSQLLLLIIAIVAVALVSIYLSMTQSLLIPMRDVVITFWIAFVVGIIGAGVYLSVILITEKHLRILENRLIGDLSLMTGLYILSGGFVAAVTQVSTGILTASGVQAVFMLGFGWQGAISGFAGTSTRAELTRDNQDLAENVNAAEEERDSALKGFQTENTKLKTQLAEAFKTIRELRDGGA